MIIINVKNSVYKKRLTVPEEMISSGMAEII